MEWLEGAFVPLLPDNHNPGHSGSMDFAKIDEIARLSKGKSEPASWVDRAAVEQLSGIRSGSSARNGVSGVPLISPNNRTSNGDRDLIRGERVILNHHRVGGRHVVIVRRARCQT